MLSNEHREPLEINEARIGRVFPSFISDDTRAALVEMCRMSFTDVEEHEILAHKTVAYMRYFLLRYPKAAEALFIGEELGGKTKQDRFHAKAEKQFTGRDVRRGDIWNGAGEHSLAVGMLAEILAQKMKLPAESVQRVAMAGALHDWWKKHEIMQLWDAEDSLARDGYDLAAKETVNNPAVIAEIREAFDTAKKEDQDGLRELGVSEDVIQLTSASRIRTKEGPQTDEERILFFVDLMMAGVRPMDMMTRINDAVHSNPLYTAYENSFKGDLGGKTMHELLKEGMGKDIIQNIATRIEYEGDLQKIHEYLIQLLQEAVVTSPVPSAPAQ